MKTPSMFVLPLCLAVAVASPVDIEQRATVDQIGISTQKLAELKLFAQYAGSAYCYDLVHNAGERIVCGTNGGSCPFVEVAQPWVTGAFWNLGISAASGYIAIDDANKRIVLAYQGTADWRDWVDNVVFGRDETKICGPSVDCEVHSGFLENWYDSRAFVIETLAKATLANPSYRVVSTGHSKGGAVAAIAAAALRNMGYIVDLYTYGQPRLGGEEISTYITNQAPAKGYNYRVTDYQDIVPRTPHHNLALPGSEWDHYTPEYYISVNGSDILPSQVHIINTPLYSPDSGNSMWDSIFDETDSAIEDHTLYFQTKISACDSDGADVDASSVYAAIPNSPETSAVVSSTPMETPTFIVSGAPPITTSDLVTTALPIETTTGPGESTSEEITSTVGPAQSTGYDFSSTISTTFASYVPTSTKVPSGNLSSSSTSIQGYITSIVWTTSVYTVTSCAPTVTDCPNHSGYVTTETVIDHTTVCLETETSVPVTGSGTYPEMPSQSLSAPVGGFNTTTNGPVYPSGFISVPAVSSSVAPFTSAASRPTSFFAQLFAIAFSVATFITV